MKTFEELQIEQKELNNELLKCPRRIFGKKNLKKK